MLREELPKHIVKGGVDEPIVSSTGKASRELFETRVANGQSHCIWGNGSLWFMLVTKICVQIVLLITTFVEV